MVYQVYKFFKTEKLMVIKAKISDNITKLELLVCIQYAHTTENFVHVEELICYLLSL